MPGDFFRSLEVRVEGRFLDVRAPGGPSGVDIDGHERFRGIDHDGAATGKAHFALEGGLDLRLNLVAREEGDRIFVALDAALVARHDLLDEFQRLAMGVGRVDEDLADILPEVIPDRPKDDVVFLVDQLGRGVLLHGAADGFPDLPKVVEVPLQLFAASAHTGGAHDHAHAVFDGEAAHGVPQLIPLFPFDATGDAARARIVRHEDEVATGEGDKGGEGRTLGAALFLIDLDDEFLPFLHQLGNAGPAFAVSAFPLKVLLGDFL